MKNELKPSISPSANCTLSIVLTNLGLEGMIAESLNLRTFSGQESETLMHKRDYVIQVADNEM